MTYSFQTIGLLAATIISTGFTSASAVPRSPFPPLPKAPPVPFHSSVGDIRWLNCSNNVPASVAAPSGLNGTTWPSSLPPLPKDLQCGRLDVPMDYSKPISSKNNITIAFTKVASNTTKPKGLLYYNQGGPGYEDQSYGWQTALNVLSAFSGLREFDLVFLDPRGTGDSNQLKCNGELFRAYNSGNFYNTALTNKTAFDEGTAQIKSFVKSCQDMSTPKGILGFLGSGASVNDWESIRIALGYKKVSWLGTSYGTYWGAEYASQFPDSLDQIAFDATEIRGATDLDLTKWDVKALNRLLKRSDAWCSRNETCPFYQQGKGAVVNAFKTASNLSSSQQNTNIRRTFGNLMVEYPQFANWAIFLDEYLKQAKAGFPNGENGTIPAPPSLPSTEVDNFSLLVTYCEDTSIDDPTWSGFQRIAKEVAKDDPNGFVFAGPNWPLKVACAAYPLQKRPKYRTPIKKPLMLVTADYDLSTATEETTFGYEGDFSQSTLVIRHGDDHGTTFLPNQPAQQIMVEYLRSGKMPSATEQKLVTVLPPGKKRPPVVDPYSVPVGVEAGDRDPATSPPVKGSNSTSR